MKNILIFTAFLFSNWSYGQTEITSLTPQRNTVYLEGFGQGLLNSICYDRLFRTDKKIRNSFSVGATLVPVIGVGAFYTGGQASYNALFSYKNHHLELGVGLNGLMELEKIGIEYQGKKGIQRNYYSYFTPKLGYRFQQDKGGIFFRLTFTPLFAFINRTGQISIDREVVVNPKSEFFTNVVSFGNIAFPWGGASIGYTFKSKTSK